jgi:hypothetical protein
MTLAEALSTRDGKAALDADDALALRRIIYGASDTVQQDQVDALFQLNAHAGSISPEWRELFVEVLVDFVVRQQEPAGYVGEARADWLIEAVKRHGRIREDEIEMLIRVLETADKTPARLSAFVLGAVRALALWRTKRSGRLDRADIERLRRVLFAKGGDANIAVTRAEAETLFDINDALDGVHFDPAWTSLFVHAVANAVLFQTPWAPDAEAELKRQAWIRDTTIHPLQRDLEALRHPAAFEQAVAEELHDLAHLDFRDHTGEQMNREIDALEARAEVVTFDEAHWLLDRIGRNGAFDANEQALIAFIRANAREIDPTLQDLLSALDARPADADRATFGLKSA